MTRVAPTADAVFAGVPGGGVVLHTGTKRYYSLNETGARIWSLLEEHGDPQRAIATIAAEYGIARDEAAKAVNDLVAQLTAAGLLRDSAPGS
ncbi:MAG: PqqD family protein [Gemmatimonadales bacterium]